MINTSARPQSATPDLVHIRTPSYCRPAALKRCLQALQGQTWHNWICDLYDDSPDDTCEAVVEALGDARIIYHRNQPRLYASRNIDRCFSRENPHGAGYFCICEDDNYFLPTFLEDNIALMQREGVEVVLRNQLIEYASGTDAARLGETGLMEGAFVEGRYTPEIMKLSLLAGIGMSHGGLFWSVNARSNFEVRHEVSATLQESIRTYALADDVWCALHPLAVWAENGKQTTRDEGFGSDFHRRKLPIKRSMMELQHQAWAQAPKAVRTDFITSDLFAFTPEARARGLAKSGISLRSKGTLPLGETLNLLARGLAIRALAQIEPGLARFLKEFEIGTTQ